MKTARFEIGQKFQDRGVRKDICTITDILTTTNSQGVVVGIEYVATHQFLEQTITARYLDPRVATGRVALGYDLPCREN